VAAAVVDFLIAFLLLAGLMFYYRIVPGWGILLVPLLLALAALAAVGVGSLLAALNVAYRDFKYTIPFLMQIWMFATPTVYMNVPTQEPPTQSAQAQSREQGAGSRERGAGSGEQGATSSLTPDTSHLTPSSPDTSPLTPGTRPVGRTTVARGWVKSVLRLNPMTGLIGFFRAAVLGGPLPWAPLGTSVAIICAVLIAGLMYFRRVESSFADII
jgi:lipopolysaccharide transport system permease protein